MNKTLGYRPDIDGLRAFAVLPVIFFHADYSLFSGGFVGVDVFFVISGFLITSIIYKEMVRKEFSLSRFYERRARRILPALFIVMFCCVPIAYSTLLPAELTSFGKSIIGVNLFSSNTLFWMESGYFESSAELKPLLHTWTLSVEEQFYIFFPLLLLVLMCFKRSHIALIILLLCCASFSLSLVMAAKYPEANFYLLPTRAWELGLGCLAALLMPYLSFVSHRLASCLAVLGLLTVLASIFFLDESFTVPGVWGLLPVLGTALIMAFSRAGGWVYRFLSLKVFVGIGLVSYGAYLWHQPIFAFYRTVAGGDTSNVVFGGLIVASMVLAALSWKYIEAPFRQRRKISKQAVVVISVLGVYSSTGIGAVFIAGNGLPDRFGDAAAVLEVKKYDFSAAYRDGTCFLSPSQNAGALAKECTPPGTQVFLWGDSHAAALSYGANRVWGDFSQVTASACPPIKGLQTSGRVHCKGINDLALEKIEELKPRYILIYANWLGYGGDIHKVKDSFEYLSNRLPNSQLVVVGTVPQWVPTLPDVLVKEGIPLARELYVETPLLETIRNRDEEIKALVHEHGGVFISLVEDWCKGSDCLGIVKGPEGQLEPFVWDYGHMTMSASYAVAKKVKERLEQ